jgi:hypothetical protein
VAPQPPRDVARLKAVQIDAVLDLDNGDVVVAHVFDASAWG